MDVKMKLFGKLMTYNAAFFDKQNSGDILFRFNADVDLACGGLLSNLKLFTTRVFSSLSLIGVLFLQFLAAGDCSGCCSARRLVSADPRPPQDFEHYGQDNIFRRGSDDAL